MFRELATVCNGRTLTHMNIPIHTFTVNVDTYNQANLMVFENKINHVFKIYI